MVAFLNTPDGGVWRLVPWVVGFTVAVWLLGRLTVGKRKLAIREGYLLLVVGLRRHGKTLFVARLAAERIAAGIPVYANFTMEGARKITDWQEVILAPRGSYVILDEVSGWCGSRAGSTLRPAVRFYISQCGKLDHEVHIVAQHETQVAGEVRDQINEVVECKKMPGGRHRATSYAPHEFRKKNARVLWSWWYTPKDGAAKIYKTKDLVRPAPRNQSYDEDYLMIDECIDIIKRRDFDHVADVDQLDAWLDAAGVG